MWLPDKIVSEVDEVARVHYVDVEMCRAWNENRRGNELRLLTGWCWTARSGRGQAGVFRQGFKTKTVAYRDAYYSLVRKQSTPALTGVKPATLRAVA